MGEARISLIGRLSSAAGSGSEDRGLPCASRQAVKANQTIEAVYELPHSVLNDTPTPPITIVLFVLFSALAYNFTRIP